ncbi:MAG: DNA polymerase I [Bradymonadia bacterium]
MREPETLYLVDGSGFIFRAFHGVRTPMSAVDGTPTNAVYGFMQLLMNLLRDRDPAHVAVVFDPPGGSFRTRIYAEYKANRLEPPPELKPQFGLCREATRALGLPAIEQPDFEADDVIGTLARRWTATGRDCVIVTADKDLMQLVDERIRLWDGKEKETRKPEVLERFGVAPEQVVDVLGLAGDASDNIPGVPGIGEKTAALLIAEHGSIEALLAVAHTLKGKRGENLVQHAALARVSRELATIRCDVDLGLDLETLEHRPPDPKALGEFLARLNFRRFARDLGLDQAKAATGIDRSVYRCVTDLDTLDEVLTQIRAAGQLALDLETTGLDTLTCSVVGFSLAWAEGQAVYVPVAHAYPGAPVQLDKAIVAERLRPLIEDADFPKFGQNVKYEMQVLRQDLRIEYRGVRGDSMLAAYLLDSGRRAFNLDALSSEYLGHTMLGFQEVAGAGGGGNDARFARVDVATATQYAGEDADVALRLCALFAPRVEAGGMMDLYQNVELPLSAVLARMEQHGIRLDAFMLRTQSQRFAERIVGLEQRIYALAGVEFSLGSPKQLGEVLFEKLGLPTGKKTKTGYSTDEDVLQTLAPLSDVPRLVLEWRHLSKLRSTYLDKLPSLIHTRTGRLHTSFRQTVAATGRLSSSEPNLQNIPIRTDEGREIRRAFVADAGWKLISADYSQIELRILAHFSNDSGLMKAFAEDADVHARTAAEVFQVEEHAVTGDQRRQAKAINFGLMYGMGAFRLANDLGIDQKTAKRIIDRYFETYPGVRRYFEETVSQARAEGFVRTLWGRVRHLPDLASSNATLRQAAERVAVNTPIQGTAADLLKVAMIRLDARLTVEKMRTRVLLTVHDELVLEAPEDEVEQASRLVRAEMEGAALLRVPLKVEVGVGENWAEIH